MNIGDIKQGIRQRCRFDPRLTDDYMLNYIKQALAKFSMRGKPFKHYFLISLSDYSPGTKIFDLPINFTSIDKIEVGTADNFADNTQTILTTQDYSIVNIVKNQTTNLIEAPALKLNNTYDTSFLIKVYYSAYIDDVLDTIWETDLAQLDDYIPYSAIQPLIEYVAYQHKKNYLKDQFSQQDFLELENIEADLYKIFNERVEIV